MIKRVVEKGLIKLANQFKAIAVVGPDNPVKQQLTH